MRSLLVGLVLLATVPAAAVAQAGDIRAGQALWASPGLFCNRCHGNDGEGGFGPDLAGRHLTIEQFTRAVRQPWGVMPAFTAEQLSDEGIAHLLAYFTNLPAVAQPAAWRTAVPAGAPNGQQLLIAAVGCGQCHGPVLANPRFGAGAVGADFEWFKRLVYDHTTSTPEQRTRMGDALTTPVRMGDYSRERLPESVLEEIWRWVSEDLGLRAPIVARLVPGAASDGVVTHTVNLENRALEGVGLAAEQITVTLRLPPGATVAAASGTGYQGVRRDAESGSETAVWRLPALGPKEQQSLTVRLSGSGATTRVPGGAVAWERTSQGFGGSDSVMIAIPAAAAAAPAP